MDLTPFTQTDTYDVVIVDPNNGDDTDITVTVYSVDTKEYRKALADMYKAQGTDDAADKLLAAVTKSWVNVEFDGDKNLPCTKDNAFKVYRAVPFIRKQIDKAVHESTNFMKGKG